MTAELLERKIKEQELSGRKVKAFLFCNPHNPLGTIFPKNLILQLMEVCKRHDTHFVSDEIYGLSVFDPVAKFTSVLSFPEEQVCAHMKNLQVFLVCSFSIHMFSSCLTLSELTLYGVSVRILDWLDSGLVLFIATIRI